MMNTAKILESGEVAVTLHGDLAERARSVALLVERIHATTVKINSAASEKRRNHTTFYLRSNALGQRFLEGLAHQCRSCNEFQYLDVVLSMLSFLREEEQKQASTSRCVP